MIKLSVGVNIRSSKLLCHYIGDVLGPSMHNLHQLLHMPVGCGEQVMSVFAPDIFVANYLSATNQLTSDIKDRAIMYMEKGKPVSSCSKLTMSLVNVSLKFQTLILQIHCYFLLKKCENPLHYFLLKKCENPLHYFLLKKCENPLHCKGFSHFFQQK